MQLAAINLSPPTWHSSLTGRRLLFWLFDNWRNQIGEDFNGDASVHQADANPELRLVLRVEKDSLSACYQATEDNATGT